MARPGDDDVWPSVLAAVEAAHAGDGEAADWHMLLAGVEGIRTLLALTAALAGLVAELEDCGTASEFLAELRSETTRRYAAG